jgi:hypothetical protein
MASAREVALVTAVVNLAATLCSLYATHLETSLYGGSGSLVDLFEKLINVMAEGEQILGEIESSKNEECDIDEMNKIVNRTGELIRELSVIESRLW